jgi:2,3-bisphosphoglycerate-independent phosphoglycerate mutase
VAAARVLLVFVDGVGMGTPGAQNPFDGAPVRLLAPLAGDRRARAGVADEGVALGVIDATLGCPGLPQSATGQAVLFTGRNAIAVAGGHREGAPTRAVADLIGRSGILGTARAHGRRAALLNAFDPARAARLVRVARGEEASRHRRPPASVLAALAGGGDLRTLKDAHEGRAITFDLTGELCRAFGLDAPLRSIGESARTLAAAARDVDLAIFETFLTDKAGHAQDTTWARHEIVRLERFLEALLEAVDPREQLVVVTSDHGNLEDLSTRTHTRAPVPLLAYGAGAHAFVAGARSLLDVAPRMLSAVGVPSDTVSETP